MYDVIKLTNLYIVTKKSLISTKLISLLMRGVKYLVRFL